MTQGFDASAIKTSIAELTQLAARPYPNTVQGKLVRCVGLVLEAQGFRAPVGTVCHVQSALGEAVPAIVTGFSSERMFLMPITQARDLEPGLAIVPTGHQLAIPTGEALLGRVIDGLGQPLDGGPALTHLPHRPLVAEPYNPLQRGMIEAPLDVGISAINGLITIGCGQRIGLFAGSGVGKSVLLGMMARYCSVDVIVVGLIGERGREVKEFVEQNLGQAGRAKTVVVASPADYSPVLRFQGAYAAMAIAEAYRDSGKHVLLLMDSLTRFAQAQREVALSMGEAPATKGYPPSVFATLPQLIERAGMGGEGQGSITGIFTVLAEGDDHNDPIVDAARAILDGHIVMTRKLAELGHYPAIDVAASVSRVMPQVVTKRQLEAARIFKRLLAIYHENKDLISIGAYAMGTDPELDFAINHIKQINAYLQQAVEEKVSLDQALQALLPIVDIFKQDTRLATTNAPR